MFNFFKKKSAGKSDPSNPETSRVHPNYDSEIDSAVAPRTHNDLTAKQDGRSQKPGVTSLLQQIMAGKRRRGKKKLTRAQSYRQIAPPSIQPVQRSKSDLENTYNYKPGKTDVTEPTPSDKNSADEVEESSDAADFVKALVLQKYAHKTPIETRNRHVSNDAELINEKRHAETLLREIARSIDCTIDNITANAYMGATDSKNEQKKSKINKEPVYETIVEDKNEDLEIRALKNELKDELDKLLKEQQQKEELERQPEITNVEVDDEFVETIEEVENESEIEEEEEDVKEEEEDEIELTPILKKKSNLRPPKSDTEGYSDEDRSESKKRVTFRKHILFDDGDEQTDQETDSSFNSLTSDEEETSDDDIPDNDELLGGTVVSRAQELEKEIPLEVKIECIEELDKLSNDNSDSGFLDLNKEDDVKSIVTSESDSDVESECDGETVSGSDEEVKIEEIVEYIDNSDEECEVVAEDGVKNLVSQENKFQSQVAALNELADTRCDEAENARELICQYRKEIEERDVEIERLKCELAKAYKESELVRQRSRSLEDELNAARTYSASVADELTNKNDETIRQLRSELEAALTRHAELESKVLALERDRDRLELEKRLQEQKAHEALTAAEANTTKWRVAHESARSQAAARAEKMLSDCEWKMRELERRAREAERGHKELTETLEQVRAEKSKPSASHLQELTQLRGVATEQQRSVQSLTLQLQKVETREEALKLEVYRLKELLDREVRVNREKDERHLQTIERLEQQHAKTLETTKAELQASAASTRAALERTHAERTRTALAQLRGDAEKDAKNADRKLREVTARFENLKEELATKESRFERAIAEANSKADWELLQLRHLLDKTDITYANNMEKMNDKFEKDTEKLNEEWAAKLKEIEDAAATAERDAAKLLERTKTQLIAEKNEQLQKLKEQHKNEMDDQWEQFMSDKESCLSRMKLECRQEGEEERVKREKELLEEIAELRALAQSRNVDFDHLAVKAAACGRTLAVTEQELREALARERELREKRSDDATKIRQLEKASREQVEHLNRKCACLKKLFDDIRARMTAKEQIAEQSSREKDKEIQQLKAEVAKLKKLLLQQGVKPKLGARTRADGCESSFDSDDSLLEKTEPLETDTQPCPPRRKGGTNNRTQQPIKKRPTLEELPALPPEAVRKMEEDRSGRQRSKSVDLPAVQVPVRIKQLESKYRD